MNNINKNKVRKAILRYKSARVTAQDVLLSRISEGAKTPSRKNNSKQPLINILTRTSNRPNGFKINLDSIHSQNYGNFRHLVVVDNDDSEQYVKHYKKIYNFDYIRVNESDYNNVQEIENPNTGKRFIWNRYFNTLLDEVESGYIMYLDDDDRLANNNVLSKISTFLNEDTVTYWQMIFENGWVCPPKELLGKEPRLARIGSPCFCYHFKFKNIKWDGWKCGDFRLIKQIDEIVNKRNHIDKILVKLGNNGGGGNKIDINKEPKLKYDFVVAGWNCKKYIKECITSMLKQKGVHDYHIHIIDDGSTDGSKQILRKWKLKFPNKITILRNNENKGAAYSRWKILQNIKENNSIVVLLDLDDYISLDTLNQLNIAYNDDSIKMTIGKFRIVGTTLMYKNGYYKDEIINNQTYHKDKIFRFPSLRTFKSELINPLQEDFFKLNGKWLFGCTDVALMIAIAKQLNTSNIKNIKTGLYFYRKNRKDSSIQRVGSSRKRSILKRVLNKLNTFKFVNNQFIKK